MENFNFDKVYQTYDFLSDVVKRFSYTSYLEIGVNLGQTFKNVPIGSNGVKEWVDPFIDMN